MGFLVFSLNIFSKFLAFFGACRPFFPRFSLLFAGLSTVPGARTIRPRGRRIFEELRTESKPVVAAEEAKGANGAKWIFFLNKKTKKRGGWVGYFDVCLDKEGMFF